jgi:hypothetical protein
MTSVKDSADIGIQISYVRSTYLFTTYNYPDRWWGASGYWPWYWGGYWGGGFYNPYPITYSLTTNSFITEMVELDSATGSSAKLPVIWTAYMVAPAGLSGVDTDMVGKAVTQAFEQSSYLKIN